MQIKSLKELRFVCQADRMMNRGYFNVPFIEKLKGIIFPDYIISYLYHMRVYNYMKQKWYMRPLCLYHKFRYLKLGLKLGFSIGDECLGYACVLFHFGTVIIGGSNRLGNYANICTSVNFVDSGSSFGDFLFLASGAKITKRVMIGDEVMIAANSVVNQSFGSCCIIAGAPAVVKRNNSPKWILGGGMNQIIDGRIVMRPLKS